MTLDGANILVTGGTGFIGGRLVEMLVLKHQARVRALVRNFHRAVRLRRFDVELVHGDATDADVVERAASGCDYIFHCAFGTGGTVEQRRAATVGGTANVARAAQRAGARRLVHFSTLSVYGDLVSDTLDESAPRRKTGDLYTDTKIEAEQLVLDRHANDGLPVTVLQPTVVYGPFGGWWTMGQLDRLRRGRFALANEGQGVCNPVYVDDVVQAAIRAATCDQAVGQSFLISGPAPVTWGDYFAAFERMLGRTSVVSMSVDQIRRGQRQSRPPRTFVGWMLQVLRERPDLRQRIVNSAIGLPYRLLSRLTPRRILHGVKRRVLGDDYDKPTTAQRKRKQNGAPAPDDRPIIVPDKASLPQFVSNTRVSIDKARRLLGYEPQYALDRGMALTEQWARWANLLD